MQLECNAGEPKVNINTQIIYKFRCSVVNPFHCASHFTISAQVIPLRTTFRWQDRVYPKKIKNSYLFACKTVH